MWTRDSLASFFYSLSGQFLHHNHLFKLGEKAYKLHLALSYSVYCQKHFTTAYKRTFEEACYFYIYMQIIINDVDITEHKQEIKPSPCGIREVIQTLMSNQMK